MEPTPFLNRSASFCVRFLDQNRLSYWMNSEAVAILKLVMKLKLIWLFLYVAIFELLLSPLSFADFFLHTWENHPSAKGITLIQVEGAFFSSNGNFDATGNLFVPSGFNNYVRGMGDAVIGHGFFDFFSIYGRLSWAYINQNSSTRPGTGYGFNDQSVGLNFKVFEGNLGRSSLSAASLHIQLQADIPAYSNANSEAKLTPYQGDGSYDFTGGLFVAMPFYTWKASRLIAHGGAGFTYRTSGFSAAIPWYGSVGYEPSQYGFLIKVGGWGVGSLRTDANGFTTTPSRNSTGSGGSFFTGAINPTVINVFGTIGYRAAESTDFYLSVSQSLWAQAAPNALQFSGGFQTRIGTSRRVNPVRMSPNAYGHTNQGFVSYSLDAHILKSNDRLNLVKIDKGSQDGVEVGQLFDIFVIRKDGSAGEAVARCEVSSVKPNEAALEILEFYKEVWIDEGFLAKRLIQ